MAFFAFAFFGIRVAMSILPFRPLTLTSTRSHASRATHTSSSRTTSAWMRAGIGQRRTGSKEKEASRAFARSRSELHLGKGAVSSAMPASVHASVTNCHALALSASRSV